LARGSSNSSSSGLPTTACEVVVRLKPPPQNLFADAAGQAKVVWQMGASALLASHEMQQLMKEMTRD